MSREKPYVFMTDDGRAALCDRDGAVTIFEPLPKLVDDEAYYLPPLPPYAEH